MTHRALLACSLLAAACGGGRFLRVTVDSVPAGVATLIVTAEVGGRESEPERFAVPGAGLQTFALALPSGGKWLDVTVSAVDSTECEVGWGESAIALATYDTDLIETKLPMGPSQAKACNKIRSPAMLLVPAGAYIIGCNGNTDPACASDETPQKTVQLDAFEIDAFETTALQYAECADAGVCTDPYTNPEASLLPALYARNSVDWFQASAYCAWRGKRLPNEAEWEAAARGPAGNLYPWGDADPDCTLANYAAGTDLSSSCFGGDVTQNLIGARPAGISPFVALDIAGDLAEWTADWYATRSSLSAAELVGGPASGDARVVKGGSFLSMPAGLRGASRFPYPPDGTITVDGQVYDAATATIDHGIRCAR